MSLDTRSLPMHEVAKKSERQLDSRGTRAIVSMSLAHQLVTVRTRTPDHSHAKGVLYH
jgi:hypothetical protein